MADPIREVHHPPVQFLHTYWNGSGVAQITKRQEIKIRNEVRKGLRMPEAGGSGLPFPKFFQINRDGDPKGILVVSFT
jgi:hypothetical protein